MHIYQAIGQFFDKEDQTVSRELWSQIVEDHILASTGLAAIFQVETTKLSDLFIEGKVKCSHLVKLRDLMGL